VKGGTAILLGLLGSAGAGVTAAALRQEDPLLRVLGAGVAFGAPWAVHALLSAEDEHSDRPTCSFLYITDTHGAAIHNRSLVAAVLTENGIDFVVHGGDIADTPSLFRAWWDVPFAAVWERWSIYAAEGNHDVEMDDGAAFLDRFEEPPYVVECGNAEVFILPWATRGVVDWLGEHVSRSTAQVRIMVVHRPIWPLSGGELPRLPTDGFQLVLAGHEHVYQDSVHGDVRQIIEVSGPKKNDCPAEAAGCVADSTGYDRVDVFADGTVKVSRRRVARV